MLGRTIIDAQGIESASVETEGLGLLDVITDFSTEKTTWQVNGHALGHGKLMDGLHSGEVEGYEIHMGQSSRNPGVQPAFQLSRKNDPDCLVLDGAVNNSGLIIGTYLHGLFDVDGFRRAFLNQLRKLKNLPPLDLQHNFQENRQAAYDSLAELVRKNICMQRVYQLMGYKK